MAIELLESLNVRNQSLLLMLLLFSSREYEDLLAYLPKDEANVLKELAASLLTMDRNNRIQLLVARLKQLLMYQSQSALMTIEPSWMIEYLKKETPFVSKAIFASLSPQIFRQLKQRLGDKISGFNQDLVLSDPLKQIVLKNFEKQFAKMPYEEFSNVLLFRDLILLNARDLIKLSREIGKISLATAFSKIGIQSTAQFLSHYNQALQDEIITGMKDAQASDSLDETSAKQFLEVVFANFHNVEDLFQKSGLYYIAYAIKEAESIFVPQLAQRFPYAHGQMLIECRKMILKNGFIELDIEKRQKVILAAIVLLSSQKQIDGRFSQCTISA